MVRYGICQWADVLKCSTSFMQIIQVLPNINVFRLAVYMHLSLCKWYIFVLILNQELEFARWWKDVPILFLETNSNFDFVLYLSHIRKCNSGYQIVSVCSVFLGTFLVLHKQYWKVCSLLYWSLKFRNSSKICSVNGFWREMVWLHLILNTLVKKLLSFRKTSFV